MNKGFTLLELMGVIALLGIIALIAIPAIDRTLNSSKDNLSKTQEVQIIKGAKDYYAENIDKLPKNDNEEGIISINTLKEMGYLPFDIKNPKTGEDYNGNVVVTKAGNKFTYDVVPFEQESDDETGE